MAAPAVGEKKSDAAEAAFGAIDDMFDFLPAFFPVPARSCIESRSWY